MFTIKPNILLELLATQKFHYFHMIYIHLQRESIDKTKLMSSGAWPDVR